MTIIKAQTVFIKELIPFFKEWGFEYIDEYSQFRKTDKDGFQNVIVSVSKYDTEIWIEINLGIRKNIVETITQQFLGNLSDFQSQSNTFSISLGKLNQNPYFKYKAESEEDLEICAEQLILFMQETGMEFLGDCNSLQKLDVMFNRKPHQPILYVYNQQHRFFKGIALAKLTNNPRYKELVEIYYNTLVKQSANQKIEVNFTKLVSYLTDYSVN